MRITLGSDPEYFIKNSSGELIPAEYLLQAKTEDTDYNTPFMDGFQGEVTVVPASDIKECVGNVRNAVESIYSFLADSDHAPVFRPSIELSRDEVSVCPPSATVFGCSPSKNVYTDEVRDSAVICSLHEENPGVMMAGGHIHIGLPESLKMENSFETGKDYISNFKLNYSDIIRLFETIGVTLLTAAECSDGNKHIYKKRRLFYGLSGEFRFTKYGIEVRSPSCAWMNSPELAEMIHNAAVVAFFTSMYSGAGEVYQEVSLNNLIKAINTEDPKFCLKLCQKGVRAAQNFFGSKTDLIVDAKTKYSGIWDVFNSIIEKINSGVNFYAERDLASSWGL